LSNNSRKWLFNLVWKIK